ncbi:MAG: nitrile hydratase accessory protein [Gammaproteobacteria bacterium]|nr:nitrile hydratase accessory protein [Gammaproteobacteria bacterium]
MVLFMQEPPGELGLPMANGEMVFEQPWHGRTFAIAVTLCEQGVLTWSQFQAALIAQIDQHGIHQSGTDQHTSGQPNSKTPPAPVYYEHFQRALIAILQTKQIVGADQLRRQENTIRALPHGHDHPAE